MSSNEFWMEEKIGIGDTARLIGVASHTIRYWEKEFDFYLKADRTQGRQRRYGEDSLKKLRRIFRLLKDEGYSIAGARRLLRRESQGEVIAEDISAPQETVDRITRMIKSELLEQLSIPVRDVI